MRLRAPVTEPCDAALVAGTPHATALRRMSQAGGRLATAAVARMQETLPWFRDLPPEHRAAVGLVVQDGIDSFVDWSVAPGGREPSLVFRGAPRELVRAVTLQQVVEAVRVAVEVVEGAVPDLAEPGEEQLLREDVLRYSREIAFAAAGVYANAAEERGAWDARLEALLVDALLSGEPEDALLSRAAAVGWRQPEVVAVVIGPTPAQEPEAVVDQAHNVAHKAGLDVLAGVHAERLVIVAGGTLGPLEMAGALLPVFGRGPVIAGPAVAHLRHATGSALAALAGAAAVRAWPGAPRPVPADALLPERALAGDDEARGRLVAETYKSLRHSGDAVMETVATFLDLGGSIEATGRAMFLHANTVRYRLGKAAKATGLTPSDARDAFTLRIALTLGRLQGL
jgi:PucR C-terminal helix-turn-helix domain/GGDEF-like domain